MFDIYWNDECVCGGYETEDSAYRALGVIIKINPLTFIAGGVDGPFNSWGVYKMIDNDGFPSYHILTVVKNTYKEIKND